MAEEEPKKKINIKKIALFGLGPIVLIGVGLGIGAFLFMPTQTPVEQVEELIEKKLQQIILFGQNSLRIAKTIYLQRIFDKHDEFFSKINANFQ